MPTANIAMPPARIVAIKNPIYDYTQRCREKLNAIAQSRQNNPTTTEKHEWSEQDIRRVSDRFKLWCGSVGAHVQGRYSFDERLRDASAVRTLVLDCLGSIESALDAVPLRSEDSSTDASAQDSSQSPSPSNNNIALQQLLESAMQGSPLSHVNAMLDILFRVTVAVRPSLSADRYAKAMQLKITTEADFARVDDHAIGRMFSQLTPDLKDRLVVGSLQRRRLLQYTKQYHDHFENDEAQRPLQKKDDVVDDAFQASKGDIDSISLLSRTSSSFSIGGILNFGRNVPDGGSETSSISSVSLLPQYRVPPFPDENDKGLRICEACYLLLPLPNEVAWKRHILEDIRPYICTFSDCSADPEKIYSSRQAWFEHELTHHRRQWHCSKTCNKTFTRLEDFERHLGDVHGSTAMLSSRIVAMGQEIPQDAEAVCPFCAKLIRYRDRIKSHIGQHQKQIALMAFSDERGYEAVSDKEDSDEELGDLPVPLPYYPDQTVVEPQQPALTTGVDDAGGEAHAHAPDRQSQIAENMSAAAGSTPSKIESMSQLIDVEPEESEEPRRKDYASYNTTPDVSGVGAQFSIDPKLYSVEKPSAWTPLLRPRAWFLVPTFDIPEDGQLRLGQVLRKPQVKLPEVEGLLSRDRISKVDLSQVHVSIETNVEITLDRAAAGAPVRSWEHPENLKLSAQRVGTSIFYPNQAYVQKVLQSLQSIGEGILKGSQRRPGKLYIVRGIRVAEGLELRREKTKVVNSSVGARLTAGFEVHASLHSSANKSVEDHFAATERVIIAYSLVEVKSTFLGNIYSSAYTKGAMF